jgi:hypothetical protein
VSIALERMNMKLSSKTALFVLAVFSACNLDDGDQAPMLIFSTTFDFNESDHGWQVGFADYPAGPDSVLFDLRYAYTDDVPESILTQKSLMLSGNNLSKDLFMYLKKKISGLKPDTDYTITFNVELASNLNAVEPSSTTASVYLKAGATNSEPKSVIQSGYYVMNIDKGNESSGGQDATSLGDILIPQYASGYSLISRNNTMTNSRYVARTDSNGDLWLIIGTDSNLEGTTTVFYTRVNVVFSVS